MGTVYAAVDQDHGATVALKTLNQMTADGLLLFKNEFRALADIQHENLASLYELIEDKGQWFFTMELLPGTDFISYVRPLPDGETDAESDEGVTSDIPLAPVLGPTPDQAQTPLPTPSPLSPASWPESSPSAGLAAAQAAHAGQLDESRLRSALIQLGRGLHALHTANKIHRDIKPHNVMVTPEGRVVILDFGIMQDRDPRARQRHQLARGTVLYMAPEQATLAGATPASDFYSVGVMLYQALTGRLPFLGMAEDVLTAKAHTAASPPRALAPTIPPDLDELCQELLSIDPARRPTGMEFLRRLRAPLAATDGLLLTPVSYSSLFVGRTRELEILNDAFTAARQGQAVTLLVYGESGIGKSFLIRHFLDNTLAQTPQTLVLHGRCYEQESVPYKAVDVVIDQLSQYLRLVPDAELQQILPAHVGWLGAIFPVLLPLAERSGRETNLESLPDPLQQRIRAFDALRVIFSTLSKRTPVIVAIDDLQWADADSLALFRAVLQPPDAPSFLLIASLRTDTAPEALPAAVLIPELPGELRQLQVDKLPARDADQLAQKLLGTGADPATAALIAAEAHGHPLFIDELSRQRQLLGRAQPTPRLDEALWMRIERLDDPCRRLMEVVAIAGVPIPQAVAAQAALLRSGEVDKVMRVLRGNHLVRTQGPRLSDAIEAYHDRVRQAVFAHLSDAERRSLHGHLAVALEGHPSADLERLMVHWRGAGESERAARYAIRAAEQSQRALAFERAARLYAQALELGSLPAEERRTFLGHRALCLASCNRGVESAQAYLQAAQGADARTARGLQCRAAEQYMRSGHTDEGVAELRKVLLALGIGYPRSRFQVFSRLLLRRAQLSLRGERITIRPNETISELDRERIETCWMAGQVLGTTDFIISTVFSTESALLALRHGQADYIALTMAREALNYSVGGGSGVLHGHKTLERARAIGKTLCNPSLDAQLALTEGYLHMFSGDWPSSRLAFIQTISLFQERCHGKAYEIDLAWTSIMLLDRYLGHFAEIRRQLFRMVDEATARNDLYHLTNLLGSAVPHFFIREDNPEESRRCIQKGLAGWTRDTFDIVRYEANISLSEVDLYEGDGVQALQRTIWVHAQMRQHFFLRLATMRHQIYFTQGRAALLAMSQAGATPERLRLADTAARRLEKEPDPWLHPFAALLRAGQSALRGDREAATGSWRGAMDAFSRLKLLPFAAAARFRLGQLLGGEEGDRLREEALQQIRELGVRNPARYAASLAPGEPRLRS